MIYSFPTPANGYEAVRQAKTWEKAQAVAAELRKGGEYKAFINAAAPFSITKDNYDAQDKFTGETVYLLDISGAKPTCTCPDFAKHQDYCKHTLAIEIALDLNEQDEATEKQAAEYDAEQARLEPYGYFSH